jgi:hypothetical protein
MIASCCAHHPHLDASDKVQCITAALAAANTHTWDALRLREVVDAVAQAAPPAKALLVRVQHHPVLATLSCTHLQMQHE